MKPNDHKLTDKRCAIPFVLTTSLFFLWGFARAILDVSNKHLQNVLDISITQSVWIQVITYLGYFLTAIPAGIFINRNGYRRGIVFGLLLFSIGALLFTLGAQIGEFYVYSAAPFAIGCGLVFLETAVNPHATELGPSETSTSRLNLSQSPNGLGSLFATLVVGQLLFNGLETGGNVVVPYTIFGALVLVIAVVFTRVDLSEMQHQQTVEDQAQGNNYPKLQRHRLFVLELFALLAHEVAEVSINSYFINFVAGQGWMTDNLASVVLTAALTPFMVGRFLGSRVMRHILPQKMLLYCAMGCVCSVGLILMDIGRVPMTALIANYLFEVTMFPTIFALSSSHLENLTKSAPSLLMITLIGGRGFLSMGYVADTTNMVIPFFILWVGYMVVPLSAWYVCRESLSTTTEQQLN